MWAISCAYRRRATGSNGAADIPRRGHFELRGAYFLHTATRFISLFPYVLRELDVCTCYAVPRSQAREAQVRRTAGRAGLEHH